MLCVYLACKEQVTFIYYTKTEPEHVQFGIKSYSHEARKPVTFIRLCSLGRYY